MKQSFYQNYLIVHVPVVKTYSGVLFQENFVLDHVQHHIIIKIPIGNMAHQKESYIHTVTYKNTCKKTGIIFYSDRYKKYHHSIMEDMEIYRNNCRFSFSLSEFPKWFECDIILKYGWYSNSNTTGVSRDHMISVMYGFENGINCNLLSHPANCSLILHSDNQKKGTKCSISIEELKDNIREFNVLYPLSRFATLPLS